MSKQTPSNAGFLRRLIESKVPHTLVIYLTVGWLLTEVITAATNTFALPHWLPAVSMVILIAAIPIVVFLAWSFQITDQGVRLEVISLKGGLMIAIIAAIVFGIGTTLFQRLKQSQTQPVDSLASVYTKAVTSVSVLPFESEEDKLGIRFSGEISSRLAKHADLHVVNSAAILRAASFVPNNQESITDHTLKGEITEDQNGYHLSIIMQDIHEKVLWKDEFTFGKDANSQKGVQRRISKQVADRLGARAVSAEYCEPTDNLEALEFYHQARHRINVKGPGMLDEAEALLKQALKLDPDYAHAYSDLAITYLLQRKPNKLAADVAQKALQRCATLGPAYIIAVPAYDGVNNHYINQELQWRDALAMNPNDTWLLTNYIFMQLDRLGMIDEAKQIGDRAYKNNPLDPRIVSHYAWGFFDSEPERARQLALEAKALGDKSCNADILMFGLATRYSQSAEKITKAYNAMPDYCRKGVLPMWDQLNPEDLAGMYTDQAKRRAVLDVFESNLEEYPNTAFIQGIQLSDPDLAYRGLEKGRSKGVYIHFVKIWDPTEGGKLFRRDPRFIELIKEAEMEPYWRKFGWPSNGMCTPFGDSFICDN